MATVCLSPVWHFCLEKLDGSSQNPNLNSSGNSGALIGSQTLSPNISIQLMLWLNGSKNLQPGFKILSKALPEEQWLSEQQINAHGSGWMVDFGCPHACHISLMMPCQAWFCLFKMTFLQSGLYHGLVSMFDHLWLYVK